MNLVGRPQSIHEQFDQALEIDRSIWPLREVALRLQHQGWDQQAIVREMEEYAQALERDAELLCAGVAPLRAASIGSPAAVNVPFLLDHLRRASFVEPLRRVVGELLSQGASQGVIITQVREYAGALRRDARTVLDAVESLREAARSSGDAPPTPHLQDRLESALSIEKSFWTLRELTIALLAEGVDREAIYQQMLDYVERLEAAGREVEADIVRDVMDFLTGVCAPHMRL